MQQIFSALGQVFRKCMAVLGLMSLIGLSGLLISVSQPSYAAVTSGPVQAQEKGIDVLESGKTESREEAYEEAAKAGESPQTVQKAEENEIKAFKRAQSNNGLVEGAQNLLDKVTGNE